mmetsp:Transcript_20352/g.50003  ORF Transcript_20352/g.50003 Transcript_20352/m.50003 type:complete len:342 (-) Transcript_20352:124-1149(-)
MVVPEVNLHQAGHVPPEHLGGERPEEVVPVEEGLVQLVELAKLGGQLPHQPIVAHIELRELREHPDLLRDRPGQLVVLKLEHMQARTTPDRPGNAPSQMVPPQMQALQPHKLPNARGDRARERVPVEVQRLEGGHAADPLGDLPVEAVAVEKHLLCEVEALQRLRDSALHRQTALLGGLAHVPQGHALDVPHRLRPREHPPIDAGHPAHEPRPGAGVLPGALPRSGAPCGRHVPYRGGVLVAQGRVCRRAGTAAEQEAEGEEAQEGPPGREEPKRDSTCGPFAGLAPARCVPRVMTKAGILRHHNLPAGCDHRCLARNPPLSSAPLDLPRPCSSQGLCSTA